MKKIISLTMSILLALTFSISAFASSVYGDVNSDNKVNSSDALRVLQASVGTVSFSSSVKKLADVNGDKKVNSSDALLILELSVNKIKSFPVEQGGTPGIEHDFF